MRTNTFKETFYCTSRTHVYRGWIVAWVCSFFCLLTSIPLIAQKDFLLSMPEENKYAFNPAYAGMESSLDIAVWGREQWSGIPGRPTTQSLVAHMPLYRLNGGGGIRLVNDELGPFRYFKFELGYDYVVSNDDLIWSIGVTAGFDQITFDGNEVRTREGIYTGGLIEHNDPTLPETQVRGTLPVASVGVYVITDRLEGGIAFQDIHFGQTSLEDQGLRFDWAPGISANLFLEYGIELNDDWYFFPDIFVKYDFNNIQAIGKVNVLYGDVLNAGIGVRGYSGNTLEAVIVTAGYAVDRHFSIHYGYDIGIGGLASESSGSHELILRYNLRKSVGKGQIPKVIGHPRYL